MDPMGMEYHYHPLCFKNCQGDANASHHTTWAGVSVLGPAQKKGCHNTLSTYVNLNLSIC